MSGDVSLAADVTFPDPKGYGDRKVVLIIRQNLEDDSKEAMIGEHGVGMIHLAWRPRQRGVRSRTCSTAWRNTRWSESKADRMKSMGMPLRSSSAYRANPCASWPSNQSAL